MGATKWTLALAFIAATAMTGAAQQPANISLDMPVPAWPANGVIPPELKSHSVFVDVAKNEYIVAYPENLGSPNFEKDGPGERRITRYKLQRDVDPKVALAVTPSTAGKYKYAYSITDGPAAKQSIDQWILVLPEAAGTSTVKEPSGWFGLVQKGRKLTVTNPDWIKNGTAAVFSFEKTQEEIQPGDKKSGFEVESDLKPGFTIAFFRQNESWAGFVQEAGNIPTLIVQNATPPPPKAGTVIAAGGGGGGFGGAQTPAGALSAWQPIKDEVDKLLRPEYDSKTVLVLAPKFDKNATDKMIASDFMQGITTLSKSGALAADSAFVKATLSDLDGYVKAGGTGQLKLSAQPKGDAETQIFNAMKVSLHLS